MNLREYKEYFYYHRDKDRKPVITVCLLKVNGVCCRGVAICRKLDSPNKKVGRAIAKGRAYKAVELKCCDPKYVIRRSDARKWMANAYGFFFHKSVYGAILTDYEKELVGK